MAATLRQRLGRLAALAVEAMPSGGAEPACAVALFDRRGWVVWRADGAPRARRVELPDRWWEEDKLAEAASLLAEAGAGEAGGPGGTRAMIVAVRRSELDRYLLLLEKAGLSPTVVRLSTFAVASAVEGLDGAGVGIVYLTEDCAEITVVRDDGIVFSRSASVGLATMAPEEREALRRGDGDGASDWLGRFTEELDRTFVAYSVRERGAPLASVVLAGEGAALEPVSERIALSTGLPVRRQGLNAEGGPGALAGWGALSERFGVDLLPAQVRDERDARLLRLRLSLAGGALGALLASVVLVLAVSLVVASVRESGLESEIRGLTAQSEGSSLGEIAAVKGFLKQGDGRSGGPLEVLRVASEAAVGLNDIQITKFEYFPGKPTPLLIEGQAGQRQSVTEFVSRLQASGAFSEVESPRLKTIGPIVEFQLGCRLGATGERQE